MDCGYLNAMTPQQRRDRAFALRRQGKTFKEIGESLGVCDVRAREIYGRAREVLLGPGHWTDALGVRTQNVLLNAGLNTVNEVKEAISSGKLRPHQGGAREMRALNYGKKSHEELVEFLGMKL